MVKQRNEIDEKYQWDLSPILQVLYCLLQPTY